MSNSSRQRKRSMRATLLLYCVVSLLSTMLALSGCSSLLDDPNAVEPTSTAIPPPLPTPTSGPSHSVAIQEIHMLDETHGWAITHDGHILHASTGVESWQDVTPATISSQDTLSAANFIDANHAWVARQAQKLFSVLYTTDGGRLWLEAPILDAGIGTVSIHFIDLQNGWLLFKKAVDSSNEMVDLFHSSDGGVTWVRLANSNKPGSFFAGNGIAQPDISFLDAATGWISGSTVIANHTILNSTHDGGNDWTEQALPLPSFNNNDILIGTAPPDFFDDKNGIMPVMLAVGEVDNRLTMYVTHDGGTTWNYSAPTAGLTTTLSFIDVNTGWAVGHDASVYTTGDSGLHWTQVTNRLASNTSSIAELDFVSSTHGWAIGLTGTGETTPALFQTLDGGKTWSKVATTAA